MAKIERTPQDPELIAAFQGWLRSREDASRHNRNLLQYAAGMAMLLGIGASSGGIFAVASSLDEPETQAGTPSVQAVTQGVTEAGTQGIPEWGFLTLLVVAGIAAMVLVFLVLLLVRAYWSRSEAEREADEYLAQLVVLAYQRFVPVEK